MRARRAQLRRLSRRADDAAVGGAAAGVIDKALASRGDAADKGCLIVCTRVGKADFVPA